IISLTRIRPPPSSTLFPYTTLFRSGLALMGTEVKSLRDGQASIVDGFAMFSGNELWLENVFIPEYGMGTWTNHQARRRRKLLLHPSELNKLQRALDDEIGRASCRERA